MTQPKFSRVFAPKPGDTVLVNKTKVRYVGIVSGAACIIDAVGEVTSVPIHVVQPLAVDQPPLPNISDMSDAEWEKLNKTIDVLGPVVREKRRLTAKRVRQAGAVLGVSRATVFRIVKEFSGNWLDFMSRAAHPTKGTTRLSPWKEDSIAQAIEELWKNNRNRNRREVWKRAGEIYVSKSGGSKYDIAYKTVLRRIETCEATQRILKQNTDEQARRKSIILRSGREKLPGILSFVEIDTWPIDVLMRSAVDRADLLPRLYLTTALDTFSRSILGWHVDFSERYWSVALCIIRSVLPKEEWLKWLKMPDLDYPQHGMFYAGTMTDAGPAHENQWFYNNLKAHGFDLAARRLGKPQDSPNGEAFYTGLAKRAEQLPGALYGSPEKRGDYDPETDAAFIPYAFDQWLMLEVQKYHREPQEALGGYSPNEKWHHSMEGTHGCIPVGKPPLPRDTLRFELDMLPYEEATLQSYGYKILTHTYRHSKINHLIEKSLAAKKDKPKYKIRFDPDDISLTYLWFPDEQRYLDVPFRDMTLGPISLHESKARRAELNKRMANTRRDKEQEVARLQARQDALLDDETKKTRKAIKKRHARERDRVLRTVEAGMRHHRRRAAIADHATAALPTPALVSFDSTVAHGEIIPPAPADATKLIEVTATNAPRKTRGASQSRSTVWLPFTED